MPNKPEERLRFKAILAKIFTKYGDWIKENRHYKRLNSASDAAFDEIIYFLSPVDFQIFLMQKNYKSSDGCSVAAATLSLRDDDTNLHAQRQIVFSRAMVTDHTITHELFHFLSHPAFTREMKTKVNEGFTEYFTFKIIGARGSAAAAAAAVGDDGVHHESGYGDHTKGVEAARKFLKDVIFPGTLEDQNPMLAAIPAGRRHAIALQPAQIQILDVKNFTKRAYFKGEAQMVNFIKEQAVW